MVRTVLIAGLVAALASPAGAQLFQFGRRTPQGQVPVAEAPEGLPPSEAEIWPFPPPDPNTWWTDKWPKPAEAADPLGGRRLGRGERTVAIDNGVDASTYRLWGLPPLQWQVLRGSEMILELWVRPSQSVRQSVVRIVVRRDGETFVQARAGLACCEPGIIRRVGFDRELPDGSAASFLALRGHPMWAAPREVRVQEAGASEAVCVEGTSYDLTLVVPGRSVALRRACDSAEIGQVADALEPVLRAALGHEPRFDVIFPRGADFSSARRMYEGLIADGGSLKRDPNTRPQAPAFEPPPEPPPEAAPAPAPPTPPAPASPR
ncbi:hypothetical protein [Phenylobacterium sp.]|uniref:hypothetical protein n=1 Tax=Phenylobacterium sp. TaxID=1871053 RepID=UPI0035ADDEA8